MNNERKSGISTTVIWRKIAFVLMFVMLAGSLTGLGTLLFSNNTLDEVGTSDGGQVKEAAINGDGTTANPFQLWTLADLVEMRDKVNSGGTIAGTSVVAKTAAYKLMADIDLGVSPYNTGVGWVPIGTATYLFAGVFDGNDYIIKNLYINSSSQYLGLFGAADTATIKKIGLVDCSITSTYATAGSAMVGGIVGSITGTSSIISDCFTAGRIASNNYPLGGIGGRIYGATVTRCFNVANIVSGTPDAVGGIVGLANSAGTNFSYCYNAGNITAPKGTSTAHDIAGIASSCSPATFMYCYNTGSVTGGYYAIGISSESSASTTNCYNAGLLSGAAGANIGIANPTTGVSQCYNNDKVANAGGGTNLTTAQMTGSSALTNMSNLGNAFVNSATGSYPQLAWAANSSNPAIRAYSAASVVATGYVDPGYRPNLAPICNNPTAITINDVEGSNYTVSIGTIGGVDSNAAPYNRTLEFVAESVSITEGSEWVEIVGTTANGIILKSKNLTSTNQFAKIAFTLRQVAKDGLEQKTCSGIINITVPMVPN